MAEAAWRTNILNALERSEKQLQLITTLLKQQAKQQIPPFFGQTRLNAPTPVSVTTEPSFSYANGTPAKALIDSDRHVQADILTMPPVSVELAEKGFADSSDMPTRALVDSDRHVQCDVLTMPPVSVELAEKGFADSYDMPTRALVDSDRHVQCDIHSGNVNATVTNIPNDYAKDATLSGELVRKVKGEHGLLKQVSAADLRLDVHASYVANPSNLDVALSTRASESTLNALKNALASVGTDKVRTVIVDSLPAGTNKIGSVDVATLPSLPSGTNTIGNVNVNNFPTDYAKEAKQILTDANGHGQIDVLTLPPLPAGTNKIGSVDVATLPSLPSGTNTIGNVNAIKSGTWNIDNLLNPHPVQLTPEHKLTDNNQFSGTYSPAGSGSTTIISAVSGKVIRVYDFSLWNSGSADVIVELYFGTGGKRLFKGLLAAKTGVLKSYVRPWESNVGDSLVLALSASGTCDYSIGAVQA
jgi:hypothetical protein